MSRMFAEWKVIVIFVIVFEPFSWLLNSSEPSSLNGVKYITKWDLKYSISCYMLISVGPEHANLLNNRKLQKHQIHCNLLCFDFHKCPIFRPKCTPWLKPSTSLQPFFSFLCEIWLSFTRKLLTLNLSSARYLYQWEKAKDLVSVRGFLLVLNSRLVVNNAPTSY